MGQDLEWAVEKLREYLVASADLERAMLPSHESRAARDETVRVRTQRVAETLELAHQILWRTSPDHARWLEETGEHDRAQAIVARAIGYLANRDELDRRLGGVGPKLSASELHPAVWDAASALWRNGHYRQAVQYAAGSVNARLQDKLGRRDLSETQLVREAFTPNEPTPDAPRLRFPDVEQGTDDWTSRHGGVLEYASGCFRAIRNHATHARPDEEWSEQAALERLAALSLLARWVDEAQVDRHPRDPYNSPAAAIGRVARVVAEDQLRRATGTETDGDI